MARWPVVEIGNPHGRIALYLDERDAYDLVSHLRYDDIGFREIMGAIKRAYPGAAATETTDG